MILIITHKLDFTADYVINILNERNIPYRRFNCEDVLNVSWDFKYKPDFTFDFLGVDDYKSVWFRRTMLPDLSNIDEEYRLYITTEIDVFLKNLFSVIDAKWISDPNSIYKSENKMYQLRIAHKLGFNIPETLITSKKEEIVEFYNKHKKIIVKPLSQTRINKNDSAEFIFTSTVSHKQINKLSDFDMTPCIFQKEIDKTLEIRATVIGDSIFSAQVNSQSDDETKVDWRRKRLSFTPFNLPLEMEIKCINLVKDMGLCFGAIDLILSPNGTYTFLEINPNGQWVWIENETGLPISDTLINYLLL